jgi:non-specific serine/threonine protein kinase
MALIQNEVERARAVLEENLERCLLTSYRIGEARCRFFLALVWWRLGDVMLMERQVSKALDLFAAESDRIGMGVSLIALAMIARQHGDLPRAETLLEEAKQRCEEAGFGWGEATCAYYQGEMARARGDYRLAADKLREALRRYHKQGDPVGMSGCLSGLAVLAAVRNDLQRAAVLFAAAGKLAEGATGFFPPTETSVYQEAAAAVRHRLGDHAYYQAASTGYAMPIEHVLNEAMQVDGRLHRPQQEVPPSTPPGAGLDLTRVQQEVLALFVQGMDIAEIAELRHRSLSASYAMLARIRDRLGVTNDTELIALALKHGFKGPDSERTRRDNS